MLVKGFTLIEVLVASLLIMLGVTGYVTLQSEYVFADANVNLRMVATQLANEKLEDLAHFSQLSPAEGVHSYGDIKSNTGGQIPAGTADIRLSLNGAHTHKFNRQWQVTDWFFVHKDDGNEGLWVKADDPLFNEISPKYPDRKQISVEVTWDDLAGSNKKITLIGTAAPIIVSPNNRIKQIIGNVSVTTR